MPATKERYFYLDNLRAVLMLLGILLHAAAVYSPEQYWLIYSDSPFAFADTINETITLFRMPAFFMLSGFFAAWSLANSSVVSFIRTRVIRIGLPLLSTLIVVNSLQTFVLTTSGWLEFELSTYMNEGLWKGHLWFLIDLIFYFLLTAIFFSLPIKCNISLPNNCTLLSSFLVLSALPLITLVIMATNKLGFPIYYNIFGFFSLYELLYYGQFYVLGFVFFRYGKEQNLKLLPIVACLVIAIWGHQYYSEIAAISVYFYQLLVWCAVFSCFTLFNSHLNRPLTIFTPWVEASYTIYLFHHIIIICFGLLLRKTSINGSLGFISLAIVTTLLSFSIHHCLISQHPVLKLLFNGKR